MILYYKAGISCAGCIRTRSVKFCPVILRPRLYVGDTSSGRFFVGRSFVHRTLCPTRRFPLKPNLFEILPSYCFIRRIFFYISLDSILATCCGPSTQKLVSCLFNIRRWNKLKKPITSLLRLFFHFILTFDDAVLYVRI